MATIRQRCDKWEVRIRRKGQSTITKTFSTKRDAEKWAKSVEVDIDRGTYQNTSLAEKTTFREIFERYMSDVTPPGIKTRESTIPLTKPSVQHLFTVASLRGYSKLTLVVAYLGGFILHPKLLQFYFLTCKLEQAA